ncbi:UbiA prenyltransferase family protein [Adhaeribacter sp. BT258]|uniref:UbiA prenyltransferase family protein n=1 Tax=Adhaeribacter terrigena TaxID=2793070 RepID=A0ABS1C404_9BACT|nr:UbiA family prenyltransferase [Adhaeribacter terrigena]MBK0404128.1 UbiA prenyltransferase family protein [Adhaeribacter terrigena]
MNALKLMRIPFSVFLMPVFWFALSAAPVFDWQKAVAVFLILHVLVYPASNGYNSYFDRDEGSIGGLKHPPKVTHSLFYLVVVFDFLAVLLSLLISIPFAVCVLVYLFVSKAYSYDKIRLKKYPYLSTFTVVFFQGAFTFLTVQIGSGVLSEHYFSAQNLVLAFVSSLFLCGSYPLTQVYQHAEDKKRGDETLSLKLGLKGTFLFSAISLTLAAALLIAEYFYTNQLSSIVIFAVFTAPVIAFFAWWQLQIRKNSLAVNFENTMRMNQISSLCMSAAFLLMLFWPKLF